MVDDGLAFFNSLSGNLRIKLTEAAKPMSEHLMNLAAPPTATIASVELDMKVWLPESESFRKLSDDEWSLVVLREPAIKMRGESPDVVDHAAPDGHAFTVRDLTAAVAATERTSRGNTEWYGGIDVHHVFFEGIELGDDGVWRISWGS